MKTVSTRSLKTTALSSAALAAALAFGPVPVNAQESIGWVQAGDTANCLRLGASSDPCSRLRWTFHTWPNIVRELNRALPGVRPETGPWGNLSRVAFPISGAFAGGPFGGAGLPAPDDDSDWGPIGPIVRESLVMNSVLIAEILGHAQGATRFSSVLFEREATLRDLKATRVALDAAIKDVDMQMASMQKAGSR